MTITVPPAALQTHISPQQPDNPQLAAAAALPDLITATADLQRATWIIDTTGWRLYGHLHGIATEAFEAYTARLGGTITTGRVFHQDGRPVRDQWLDTTHSGVPVQISALVAADTPDTTEAAA